MLYKATGAANTNKWYWFLNAVLWVDEVSIRRRTECSPYFLVTGAHPTIPLDVAEATWLVKHQQELLQKPSKSACEHVH